MMVAISMYAFALLHQIIIITHQNRVAGTISNGLYFIQVQCQLMNTSLSYGNDIIVIMI